MRSEFQVRLPDDYFTRLAEAYGGEADGLLSMLSYPTVSTVVGIEKELAASYGTERLEAAKAQVFGVPVLPRNARGSRVLSRQVVKELLVLPVDTGKDGVAEVAAAFPTPEAVDQYCALVAIPRNQIQVYVASVARLDQMAQTIYSDDDGGYAPLPNVERLFLEATRKDASDIHLKVGDQPRFRIHGQTIAQPYELVTAEWMERELRRIAGDSLVDHVWAHFNADMAWQVGETTFRLNYGVDDKGLTLAARRLAEQIPSMEKINLPKSVRDFTKLERGLVLVTGPTGSGKSTTLAALLQHIADTRPLHIITLEEPIEYRLRGTEATISQRERFKHFDTFPNALRQALRQDPDIILVGEIRDQETAETVFHAAETGHLVFGTVHTYNAATTIERLINLFPPEAHDGVRQQLSYILSGIVSQTLLRRADGKGRVAAYEVLVNNEAIRTLLSTKGAVHRIPSTLETHRQHGMQRLEQALAELAKQNTVSYDEAMFKAIDKKRFEEIYKN